MVPLAEGRDLVVRAGLLTTKLAQQDSEIMWTVIMHVETYLVAGEAEDDKVLLLVLVIQGLQTYTHKLRVSRRYVAAQARLTSPLYWGVKPL